MNYTPYNVGNNIGSETSGVFKAQDVPGQRLIVCATLMGRAVTVTRDETRRTNELFMQSAHSHVSDNQLQYMVFDSRQIIPCYVIHLDRLPDMKADFADFAKKDESRMNPDALRPNSTMKIECPGDVLRKKQALKAAATKWFPYGYGRMEGTTFVTEDIADVSDDVEAYGEYQHQRIEQGHEIREQQFGRQGASWLDQYQTVRKTNVEVIARQEAEEW